MKADFAYIEPFLYDWLEHLHEIMKERKQKIIDEKNLIMPCEALTLDIIKVSTHITNYLKLDHHVKYMALELFDKFMNKYFRQAYNGKNDQSNKWLEKFKEDICNHITFYLVLCFQVACKVNSSSNCLKISQLLQLLNVLDKNNEYTRDLIFSMEINILKKIEFRMPFYTPVNCIEILLAAVNFLKIPFYASTDITESEKILFDISMDVLDLAYLQHEKLYDYFQSYFMCQNTQISEQEKQLKLRIIKSNTLFLSAAIVLCTRYILYPSISYNTDKIVAGNLAKLANAPEIDVTVMADILFQMVQYNIDI